MDSVKYYPFISCAYVFYYFESFSLVLIILPLSLDSVYFMLLVLIVVSKVLVVELILLFAVPRGLVGSIN